MLPPRLVIGKLPGDFRAALDIPAGPWCFVDHPSDFDTWSMYDFIPDVRDDAETNRSIEAFAECLAYRRRIFPILANRLNLVNRSEYSSAFWRGLIEYWLVTLLQILYVARQTAMSLADRYRHVDLCVELQDGEAGWRFTDTEDFVEKAFNNVDFFAWAVSEFLRRLAPANWMLLHKQITNGDGKRCREHRASEVRFGAYVREFLRGIQARLAPRCFGVYGIKGWRAVAISVVLSVKPRITKAPSFREAEVFEAYSLDTADPFAPLCEAELLGLIERAMPDSFRHIADLPSLGWRFAKGKIRIVGNLVVVSDAVKKAIALARQNGELVLGSQHGSSYGDQLLAPTAVVEYALDGFITWGWANHPTYAGNFIPLSAPHLGRIRHREEKPELIYVGIHVPLFYPRIEDTYGTKEVLRYVRDKIRFLEQLAPPVRDQILYRAQVFKYAMNEVPYLKMRFSELRLLEERPEKKLASCRLVVIDSPSTVFFQALAANIPTIAFWSKSFWRMHGAAEALYDELRQAGILHEDPETAAQKINDVWDSVQEWWQGQEVQAARTRWCHEYARTSPKWFGEWVRTLWGLWSAKC